MARKPKPAPIFEKRSKNYRLHFCYNGRQHRRFYISNENVANVLQSEINNLIIQFKNGLITLPPGYSLADFIFESARKIPNPQDIPIISITSLGKLIVEYQEMSRPPAKAESTCRTEKIHLNHLREFIQKKAHDPTLENMKPGFFELYKKFRYTQGVRTDTVNKELATFHTMIEQAVNHGYLSHNVLKNVKRDKSQVPCDRFRSHQEVQQLIATGNFAPQEIKELKRYQYLTMMEIEKLIAITEGHWLHPILITFSFTGMRRGEITKLQWIDVDFKGQCIYLRSRKQSQRLKESIRRIPIHDRLLPILKQQYQKTGTKRWVYLNPSGTQLKPSGLSDSLKYILKKTEFEGLGFHIFRHSLCSNLAAKGVEQHFIDGILGHHTEIMRQRYRHLFPKHVKEALDKIQIL